MTPPALPPVTIRPRCREEKETPLLCGIGIAERRQRKMIAKCPLTHLMLLTRRVTLGVGAFTGALLKAAPAALKFVGKR